MTTKLRYFKQANLDQLKASLAAITDRFERGAPWVDDFFEGRSWSLESNVVAAKDLNLRDPDSDGHHDLENAVRVHEALKGLTIRQATDERLWAELCVSTLWSYMRKRWPVENYSHKDPIEVAAIIRERYFFIANRDRALVRNGLARLWWYGHVSYDAQREDPYELTKVLLDKLDVAQSLLERSFSRNPTVCKAVLNFVLKEEAEGRDATKRAVFRALMQHLNRLGGMAVLDVLNQEEIEAELLGASRLAVEGDKDSL